nr:hypothetical protein [Tanacetum cinerariifolium]
MGERNWNSHRSWEDLTQKISKLSFVTNFPDYVSARDLWGTCKAYGTVVDVFIPYKKSKAGKRFAFVRFIKRNVGISSDSFKGNVRNYSYSFASVLKSGKPVTEATGREVPSLVLDDTCFSDRDFNLSLMRKVKDITALPNLYVILKEEGFQNFKISYLGGMWVLIELESSNASQKFIKHAGVGSWFSSLQHASNSFVSDERIVWISIEGLPLKVNGMMGSVNEDYASSSSDEENEQENEGSRNGEKYESDKEVDKVSESSCMQGDALFYHNNNNKSKESNVQSENPFNIYDLLNKNKNKNKESEGNSKEGELKYPLGFTPKETFVNEVHGKEMEAPSEEVMQNSYNSVRNNSLNASYCSQRFKACGSIINLMDELVKVGQAMGYNMDDQERIDKGVMYEEQSKFCISSRNKNETYRAGHNQQVMGWDGKCVIMGDFNEVRSEHERYGSVFNVQSAAAFNNFISLASLIDLPLDGYVYTWETVWIVEEEAYAAREAWAHSVGLSHIVYHELQTLREQVYAQEYQLQTHQTQLQLQSILIQILHQLHETHSQIQQTEMAGLREIDHISDSSGYDADDEDEDDEEEDEHLAPADSAVVIPIDELASPPEGTEPIIPPPSTDTTTTGARITIRPQTSISLPPEAKVERLLAMPTPSPSPLTSLSPPSAGERLARYTTPAALLSPPRPLSVYPPPVDRGDDIPETYMLYWRTLRMVDSHITAGFHGLTASRLTYGGYNDSPGDSMDRGGGGLCCPRGLGSFGRV